MDLVFLSRVGNSPYLIRESDDAISVAKKKKKVKERVVNDRSRWLPRPVLCWLGSKGKGKVKTRCEPKEDSQARKGRLLTT